MQFVTGFDHFHHGIGVSGYGHKDFVTRGIHESTDLIEPREAHVPHLAKKFLLGRDDAFYPLVSRDVGRQMLKGSLQIIDRRYQFFKRRFGCERTEVCGFALASPIFLEAFLGLPQLS